MAMFARHIQDHNEANTTQKHYWGYPSRILPCTKDQGTCEYLEAVYSGHDTSMLYTFILWAVILGVLSVWSIDRFRQMTAVSQGRGGFFDDIASQFCRLRRHLLPDAPGRALFGRVSRLQVMILAVVLSYLLIFSLIAIPFQTWVTPIKGSTLYNTRTGLGPWSDRIGALAYALTPFAVLLCQRESVLSLITGIPYQHFNFLHRWLGRVIFVQSFLHTVGWTIVEAKLYQPQPLVYTTFIKQQYIIFGIIAMFFITWLTLCSTQRMIRWTGYEFFKITHWVIAVLYIGACWGHWDKLYCWMVPSLALITIDQSMRYVRTAYLHSRGQKHSSCFQSAEGRLSILTDDNGTVIRLEVDLDRGTWQAGQHFFLTFPSLSIWQSHPYTVSSLPNTNSNGGRHIYLIRVRNGQTRRLAAPGNANLPVILTGPYGNGFPGLSSQHILAVSGGTGVTFALPIMQAALRRCTNRQAVLEFAWVVRTANDLLWLKTELVELKDHLKDYVGLNINIFITRQAKKTERTNQDTSTTHIDEVHQAEEKRKGAKVSISSAASDICLDDLLLCSNPRFTLTFLKDHHPSVADIVSSFHERASDVGGAMEIVGSGPGAMGSDLRAAVAAIRNAEDVSFYWDSRE